MKVYSTLILLCIMFFSFCSAMAQTSASEDKCVELSKKVLNHLVAGEYEEVSSHFDEQAKASLNTEQLKQVWEGLTQRIGAFQASKGISTEEDGGYLVVTNNLEFEKSTIGLRLAYNDSHQVSRFFFVPAE